MTALDRLTFEEVLGHFRGVRRTGDRKAMALCPAHDDHDPSLSIAVGETGCTLLKCHAGCSYAEIRDAAGLEPAAFAGNDKPPPRADSRGFESAEVAIEWMRKKLKATAVVDQYVYCASDGGEVFRIVRYEPKDFRPLYQQRNGRWRFKDPPGQLPVYRLDRLANDTDAPVALFEGEKKVHVAEQLGVTATTSAHGSKSPQKTDWSPLAGRTMFLWADADDPGARYANQAATILTHLDPPATVRVITPVHELGKGADICDWYAAGGTAEQLAGLIADAKPWQPTRAVIEVNRQLRDVTAETLNAIEAANDPPVLFVRGGALARIRPDENCRPVINKVGLDQLRHRISRSASFVRVRGDNIIDVPPPDVVVRNILASEAMWPCPPLVGVTEVPVLHPDGTVLATPGYDAATRLYYVPDPGLVIPAIPAKPTRRHAEKAVRFILDDVLVDFRFVRDGSDDQCASQANMLATLLTPIARPLIDGSTPMAVIDAPTAGSGKGLLASVTAIVATGRPAAMFGAPTREEEWGKQITSSLLGGGSVIVIDNVVATIRSAKLSLALTAPVWDERILGGNTNAGVPVRVTWIATGNNVRLGLDIPRRAYWVRIDPEVAEPWERGDFKHQRLLPWVQEHRGEIVAALLTMARAWHVAGAEPSPIRLGSFEAWSETVGGILDHAGIEGFLTNRQEMLRKADDDGPQWAAFLTACAQQWESTPFTAHEVADRLQDTGGNDAHDLKQALPDHLADALEGKNKSFTRRLGKGFSSIDRRRFDKTGLRVERAGRDSHAGAQRWRVVSDGGSP